MLQGKVAPIQPPPVKHGRHLVEVIVGPQEEEFAIHKDLICAASKFFEVALASNFIEAKEQKVALPEEDPQLFRLVYDWLYSGRVADGVTTSVKKEDVCSGDVFWWKMYNMGDRLMMDRLRVLAVAKIQNMFTTKQPLIPNCDFIKELFENAQLPHLETQMIKHVVYWLNRSTSPTVWNILSEAHVRFGQALLQAFIQALERMPVDETVHKGVWKDDGYASPWKIAGVADESAKNAGGGTEIRAKHMRRAMVNDSKVKADEKELTVVKLAQTPSNTLSNQDANTDDNWHTTSDGRVLVPLYFPKDGLLNKDDLAYLLREAYQAADLQDLVEEATLERLLGGLGLTGLSNSLHGTWVRNSGNGYFKLFYSARWEPAHSEWSPSVRRSVVGNLPWEESADTNPFDDPL